MDAIQTALGSRDVTLMVDTNHAYGRREALMLGDRLADANLRWYEEPVVPEDIEGYAEMQIGRAHV